MKMTSQLLCTAVMSAVLGAGLAVAEAQAQSQNYPNRQVRVVLGFAPGGAVDILARAISQKLSERLGASFYVDNRPGANGVVGSDFVAKSDPDGYTLLMITTSFAVSATTAEKLPFDPVADFAPVILLATVPNVIMAAPNVPVSSLKELIALLKKEPGKHNFASTGIGGATHLAGESFKITAGVDMVHVPYKGAGLAINSVVAGEVTSYFGSVSAAKSFANTGKLKILAVVSDNRTAALPDVPTVGEAGLPEYKFTTWYGLLAPAKTPPAVVSKLRDEIAAVMSADDMRRRLEGDGGVLVNSTPEAFRTYMGEEIVRLRQLVRAAKVEVQ